MSMKLLMCPNITELDLSLPEDSQLTSVLIQLLSLQRSLRPMPDPVNQIVNTPSQSQWVASHLFGSQLPSLAWQKPHVLQKLRDLTMRRRAGLDMCDPLLLNLMSIRSL